PDPSALLAYEIHLEEGFEPDRYVDIFDAGPVLTAQVDRTASVAGNETRTVREAAGATNLEGAAYLVASQRAGEFRCVLATLPESEKGAGIIAPLDASARAVLGVQDGEPVRCAPLYRATPQTEDAYMGDAQ
ncbi:arginine N-succinyltransferase, partial [Paraburkholderia sp. BR14261]